MSAAKYACAFEELIPELDELLGKYGQISVRVLNFRSQDELDYEVEPNLTAIVVGGNKLSRGLTIEGLLVSYFLRATKQPKADTLTQMGRFFGYRKEIVDITRVYTTDQLRSEFRDISQLEFALRAEITRYIKYGKTPEDFAPRVQRKLHLMPTAKNKMKKATALGISYSGDLVQTTSFPNDGQKFKIPTGPAHREIQSFGHDGIHQFNYSITKLFIEKLLASEGSPSRPSGDSGEKKRWLWRGVPVEQVKVFLNRFQTVNGATRFDTAKLVTYVDDILTSSSAGNGQELSHWSVALVGRNPDELLGVETFGTSLVLGRISRSLDNGSKSSIGTLVNPISRDLTDGDELIDLTDVQVETARKELFENPEVRVTDAIRSVRPASAPLLVIYPISPHSKPKNSIGSDSLGETLFGESKDITIIGLSLVFPHSVVELEEYWSQESEMDVD
jgi:hypothetical protein